MSTANVAVMISDGEQTVDQRFHLYTLSGNDTVHDLINFCRSSYAWPLHCNVEVLRKRSVDNKVNYTAVKDSFKISPDDSYEITVFYAADTGAECSAEDVASSSADDSQLNHGSIDTNYTQDDTVDDHATLEQLYDSHKKEIDAFYGSLNGKTKFGKINLSTFFNQNIDRAFVYALHSKEMVSNISILATCRDRLKRYLRKIIDIVYPSFSAHRTNLSDLYTTLMTWIDSMTMASCRDAVSSIAWSSYLTARYRYRKKNPVNSDAPDVATSNVKKRKHQNSKRIADQDFDYADGELKNVARLMLENKTPTEIRLLFKESINERYSWIQYILEHPDFEKGAAEAVIDRFPRLLDNVNYLHDDYVYFMKKQKLPVCDLAKKFRQYVPAIFDLALSLHLIKEIPVEQREMKAGETLPLLIKRYHARDGKRCCKERFIIGSTTSININEIIRHKDELEITAPMIAYVKRRNDVEFYIVVDQKAMKVPGSFADALQSMHELQFVLNLAYDSAVAPLFIFLEYVLGLKVRECDSRFRLKHDIESFIDDN